MEPVTSAILATVAVGITKGLAEAGIKDVYGKLKDVIKLKFGRESDIIKAVDNLEMKPDSAGRKKMLEEEIIASKANLDSDVLEVAQALLELIKAQPNGEHNIQTAIGNYIAQADREGTASVNVNHVKE